jgi:hypothetical protein
MLLFQSMPSLLLLLRLLLLLLLLLLQLSHDFPW